MNDENFHILRSHINAVVGHFKGKVKVGDVVNECLDDDQVSAIGEVDSVKLERTIQRFAEAGLNLRGGRKVVVPRR